MKRTTVMIRVTPQAKKKIKLGAVKTNKSLIDYIDFMSKHLLIKLELDKEKK